MHNNLNTGLLYSNNYKNLNDNKTFTTQQHGQFFNKKFKNTTSPNITSVKPSNNLQTQTYHNNYNEMHDNHQNEIPPTQLKELQKTSSVRRIRKSSIWRKRQQQQFLSKKSKNNDGTMTLNNPPKYATNDEDVNAHIDVNNDGGAGGDIAVAKNLKQRKNVFTKAGLVSKVKAFIIEFLQDSSIHGFVYLAKIGLHCMERTLWFAFICVAIYSIISLSHRTWQRFQTSPMVISMDRNKLVWNTSFPSLTVCPHKRIDELKVEEYMMTYPEIFTTDEDKEGFKDFIDKLSRLSYDNIDQLPLNKTYGISSDKFLDLIHELKWQFEPEISSGAAMKMYIYETQTEFGICHSVNSLVARYNSYEYWKNNDWDFLDHGERVTVHPLDGEIYAQIINLSTAYDVYFHSSGDIPSITKQRYTFPETDYTTIELIALEIYTDEAAKAFSPKQRKCRFQYEAEEMLTAPIYSFGLCLTECRLFLALRVCNCVPHFYRNKLRNGRILPICNLRGLACVANLKKELISLKSQRFKIDCNCLSNCDDSNFFVQSYRSRVWFLGANLQWGVIDYPKMQLRRDVLFSFADVLVYIGGLVGFFLGCSALSFTEILYYFTIRFARRLMA